MAVANVQSMYLDLSTIKLIDATEAEIERYKLRNGDLLLTEGGDPDKLGRGTLWHGEISECIHQNHIFRVRTGPSVDPVFLQWAVASESSQRYFLRGAKQTTGIASINLTQLRALPVVLPPMEEQRKIAHVLDGVKALRAKRRQTIALLNDLTYSVFLEMFGDPAHNQKKLSVVRLGELTAIGTGSTPDRGKRDFYGGSIPWIKTGEVRGDLIIDTEEKITERGAADARCKIYPIDSIVIALYGQGKTRGQCAILGVAAATNQACAVLLPNPRTYNTQFMFQQLRLSYERLRAMARGGNQANLNLKLVAGLSVLCPSVDLQQEFAKRVKAIEAEKAKHREALAKLDDLFKSVQSRAFAGTLFG
jgi:type I restriction enzyme S subunit